MFFVCGSCVMMVSLMKAAVTRLLLLLLLLLAPAPPPTGLQGRPPAQPQRPPQACGAGQDPQRQGQPRGA
jgi:hypothetical protein